MTDEPTTVVLARIDERVKGIDSKLSQHIEDEAWLVTRPEFLPVQRIAYGLVAVAGTAVVASLIGLLVNR